MKTKGFTLIELMVVILIVGILAAASIPLMRGRIESAKWAEANAMAGTIKSAARVYYAEKGSVLTGDVSGNMAAYGFDAGDLTGTYFTPECFNISNAGTNGNVEVTVTAANSTSAKAPTGVYILETDGDWTMQ